MNVALMDQGKELVLDDDLGGDQCEWQPHVFVVRHFGI